MNCPYCGKEMKKGIMSCDGRQGLHWKEGEKKANFIDTLGGGCALTASKMHGLSVLIKLEANFCPDCKKMIIDTDVTPGY